MVCLQLLLALRWMIRNKKKRGIERQIVGATKKEGEIYSARHWMIGGWKSTGKNENNEWRPATAIPAAAAPSTQILSDILWCQLWFCYSTDWKKNCKENIENLQRATKPRSDGAKERRRHKATKYYFYAILSAFIYVFSCRLILIGNKMKSNERTALASTKFFLSPFFFFTFWKFTTTKIEVENRGRFNGICIFHICFCHAVCYAPSDLKKKIINIRFRKSVIRMLWARV